ncbi:carboxymuconolactone decarboxylase family protein [Streptomyces sp. 549]|uniref:carboxymuconolactone decarboxylase family protein n=1 Tax=Streptomyces sp. 549 TaxID=3049076 RepID=UPI0024C3E027|nr:carboxymuconolactone decarboxylase family protein [Streptomyces sp. 549]MDK1474924.1 carboxymuconolactone decarboxylase family protein [Streptomyces sp. 549]
MASSTRVPAVEINGVYGALLKRMSRRMLGQVPESIGVMWNNPPVFKDLMGFGRKAEKWDRLDPQLSTLAHMASAGAIGCGFCLDLHYFMTRRNGLDEAKAREVPRWRDSDAFTPLERRVMEYAEAMCQTPPTVTDEMSARLAGELGAAALVELTAKVAFMNATSRLNVSLGIRSQEFAASCGLPPLAVPSTDVASPS